MQLVDASCPWALVLLASVLRACAYSAGSNAAVSPLWPQPVSAQGLTSDAVQLHNSSFTSTCSSNDVLEAALHRYYNLIFGNATTSEIQEQATLRVTVCVRSKSADLTLDTNTSYSLVARSQDSALEIQAETAFGALHALETLSQLADDPLCQGAPCVPQSVSIEDEPRFKYRGIMMDLARHFYSVPFLMKTIDALAANKMNMLHLHITDDQSFPLELSSVPSLTKGAFGPQYVYTSQDLATLIGYATQRGVMILPELDMPAHSSSWRIGEPDIMVPCSSQPRTHGDTMNPCVNATFDVLNKVLGEVSSIFVDSPMLHLGGDEVPQTCWLNNASIVACMKRLGIQSANDLQSYFVNTVASLPNVQQVKKPLVYWQEVLDAGAKLKNGSVIQAWKSDAVPEALHAGLRVINSYLWYLNHGCNNDGDGQWQDFYSNEPDALAPNATQSQLKLILGGETAMWSECVDEHVFDAVAWLRTTAAAEKMWSPKQATSKIADDTRQRLALHRCRLLKRGVTLAPVNDMGADPLALNPTCM